jgi:hypothetical protein
VLGVLTEEERHVMLLPHFPKALYSRSLLMNWCNDGSVVNYHGNHLLCSSTRSQVGQKDHHGILEALHGSL